MTNKRTVTKKRPMFGNNRPFSLKATRRRQNLNMQWKRFYVPELDRMVRVRLTAEEIRTVDKIGLRAYLAKQGRTLESVL